MKKNIISATINRYCPDTKKVKKDTFEVPHSPGMTIQVLLRHIYENIDPSLAFRDYRCGIAICNTCLIKLNGKVVKSCQTLVENDQEISLEPATKNVIKDLVIYYK